MNLAIDGSRRNRRVLPMPERELISEAASPYTIASRAEEHKRLHRALQRLGESERAALVLRDIEGLPTSEVATLMGVAEPTIRVQIAKARLKLREWLR